ncbi:hypothetical protein CENSYa_1525 [Cenarchaeum symbiosum A]|uniref:Uncharacterized protein n=1 Tax=Cenarchaeum symbiosum (strain A) TaxID=414004 RepID=A0RXT0_CENSY|nr:hypothetical protein CENSYa_1525 [Cenarchaeum symbiosum A]
MFGVLVTCLLTRKRQEYRSGGDISPDPSLNSHPPATPGCMQLPAGAGHRVVQRRHCRRKK